MRPSSFVEADRAALSVTGRRLHRAVEVGGHRLQLLRHQPIDDQLSVELVDVVDAAVIFGGQHPRHRRERGDRRQPQDALEQGITNQLRHIPKPRPPQHQLHDQQQIEHPVRQDALRIHVREAAPKTRSQIQPLQ